MLCIKISEHWGILSYCFGASRQRDLGAFLTEQATQEQLDTDEMRYPSVEGLFVVNAHRRVRLPRVSSVKGHILAHFLLEIQREMDGGHIPAAQCLCLLCNNILLAWSRFNKKGIYCQVIKCQDSLKNARMKTICAPGSLHCHQTDL